MALIDRLSKNNFQEKDREAKRARDFYMEEEETLMYKNAPVNESINRTKSVFDTKQFEGINTQKSVFDKSTVFDTRYKNGSV